MGEIRLPLFSFHGGLPAFEYFVIICLISVLVKGF